MKREFCGGMGRKGESLGQLSVTFWVKTEGREEGRSSVREAQQGGRECGCRDSGGQQLAPDWRSWPADGSPQTPAGDIRTQNLTDQQILQTLILTETPSGRGG